MIAELREQVGLASLITVIPSGREDTMLKALLGLFGAKRGLDPEHLAKTLWDSATMQAGDVSVGGIKIPVTFELYAMARLSQAEEELKAARQSGRRIDHRAGAVELFTAGLSMIAGQARSKGVSFADWATDCSALVGVFTAQIEPLASQLDTGTRLGKVSLHALLAAAPRQAFGINMGLQALVDFLNQS